MRCTFPIACGAVIALACDRRDMARQPDTPVVQTIEQYEASLPYNPVRDSADAVRRVLQAVTGNGVRGAVRVTSVVRDTAGYLVTFERDGPDGVVKGLRMRITYRGGLYEVIEHVR